MKELSIKAIRGENFPFHINRGISSFRLKDLISDAREYVFDLDVFLPSAGMNLQRGFVWTEDQKAQLILSILKGIRIPPLTFILKKDRLASENQVWQVIDGKQRLSAMIDFVEEKFPVRWEGVDYFLNDLPEDCRREVLGFWPVMDIGYEYGDKPISDADKIRWFELINFAGTPQDAAHFTRLQKAMGK